MLVVQKLTVPVPFLLTAGYFMDCPKKHKQFKTCNEWVASNPDELKEAYWKIRGVYVYERAWERQWT